MSLTKAGLIRKTARQIGEDPQAVHEIVESFLSNIGQALKAERSVRLKSFGVFLVDGTEVRFQVSPTLRVRVTSEDVIADVAEEMRANSRLPGGANRL